MITLVAVLCHFNIVPLCVDVVVARSDFPVMVGKADAPIPYEATEQMALVRCKMEAPIIVASWMEQNPLYHDGYYVKEMNCIPGEYIPRHSI